VTNPRILLLQARRAGDAAQLEERTSFSRAAGVAKEQVIPFDLLADALTVASTSPAASAPPSTLLTLLIPPRPSEIDWKRCSAGGSSITVMNYE
jgi:hypothetical protein